MAAKIARGEIGLRPPPGRRWYLRLGPMRGLRRGKSGSTRDQSASESSQDCTVGMEQS